MMWNCVNEKLKLNSSYLSDSGCSVEDAEAVFELEKLEFNRLCSTVAGDDVDDDDDDVAVCNHGAARVA